MKKASVLAKLMCLVLALLLATATGCSDNPDNGSSDSTGANTSDVGGAEDTSSLVDDTSSNQSSNQSTTDSSAQSGTSSTTSTGKGGPNTGNSTGTVDAEKYRGTTVRFATWKDPYKNEDGPVVTKFEKKYGIKVKIDTVPQATYVQEIAGMVTAGNSPDVFFDNCFFPASVSVLQPIDAMQLNLKDGIWDQSMFTESKINGKSFLVNTVGNIWSEVDCLFYNKKLFQDNNITTPEQYYQAGKWNFEAFEKCMRDLKNAGVEIGAYIDIQSLLGANGAGFYTYKNGKFTNGVTATTTKIETELAEWVRDGLIKDPNESFLMNNFIIGKAGMAITNIYGTKATGYFSSMNANDLGYCYIPTLDGSQAKVTGLFRGWGLIRGAKNPVGAGIFLRYYLDVKNYDTNAAFKSTEAKNFFMKLTTGVGADDKYAYVLEGVKGIVGGTNNEYIAICGKYAPDQISTQLASMKPKIDSNVIKLNEYIQKHVSALG